MKNVFFLTLIFSGLMISCSKKEPADFYPADTAKAVYDTTAIDSFSTGATSVDIVRQIRMSSRQYQDSVKEALRIQVEEKKLKEELEKENKKKTEDEKKNAEKEKKQQVSDSPAPTTAPE
jgi:membrane protein involved in colicin uptake